MGKGEGEGDLEPRFLRILILGGLPGSEEWKRTKIRSGWLPSSEEWKRTKIRSGWLPSSEEWKRTKIRSGWLPSTEEQNQVLFGHLGSVSQEGLPSSEERKKNQDSFRVDFQRSEEKEPRFVSSGRLPSSGERKKIKICRFGWISDEWMNQNQDS
ncbi:unnamed protein product [Rhizophagus irregularis]|nr:unnamed protein product [Rhizophagus irregularis]CAB5370624.1 unnamed protein product [Rhizophagus irregularis]